MTDRHEPFPLSAKPSGRFFPYQQNPVEGFTGMNKEVRENEIVRRNHSAMIAQATSSPDFLSVLKL